PAKKGHARARAPERPCPRAFGNSVTALAPMPSRPRVAASHRQTPRARPSSRSLLVTFDPELHLRLTYASPNPARDPPEPSPHHTARQGGLPSHGPRRRDKSTDDAAPGQARAGGGNMVPAHVVARQPGSPRAPPCLPRQGHRRVVIARLAHHVGPATSHRGHLLLDLRRRHSESNQRVASHG